MQKQPESIFTLRALLVGSIGAFVVSAGTAYGALYLKGSLMSTGTSMPGAVFVLFLITLLVNPALKLISPRAGLRRGELLLVYVMLVMASPLPRLFVYKYICSLTYPFYYATPENDWRNIVLPHLPDWIVPHSPELVQLFFEGVAQGQEIPWGPWLRVFAAWMPFLWALFLVMIASMVIMRRQWVENERLIFPLLQVPLAMVGEDGDKGRLGRFYKDPVMWAGFAVPALYGTLHGLYNYFPGIVAVATRVDPIHFTLPIFDGVHDLYFLLRFNILGFFYFLKTDIAFSIWFFNLLSFVARGVFARLGIGITETGMVATEDVGHAVPNLILAYQAMGGMLALFFGGLWMGRTHLKAVFRKALYGDPGVDDSDEILSYRAAVIILVTGCLVMVGWLAIAGLPVIYGVALIFLVGVLLVGYSRIVAEGGLSDGAPPVVPAGIMASLIGSARLGEPSMVILGLCIWWSEGRNFVMTSAAQSLRLSDDMKPSSKRPLFWVMVAAVAIAFFGAVWTIMELGHDSGAINLYRPYGGGYDFAERMIRTPTGPQLLTWLHIGAGSLIMGGLMLARAVFLWWPLHPIGYVVGPVWILDHLWFNMFLAWLVKVIVLRYGGVRLYLRTRPFFLGIILGFVVPGGIYLIIDHFTGMVGNIIFYG